MQKCDQNIYPTATDLKRITNNNHCIQNRIIHTMPAFQVDCFGSKEIERVVKYQFEKKGKHF